MSETTSIPSKLDFNEGMITGPAIPQYVDDLYEGVIVKMRQSAAPWDKKGERGDLGISFTLRACDEAGSPVGPPQDYWLQVPVANPNKIGHFVSKELKEIGGRKTSDYEMSIKKCRDLIVAVGEGDSLLPYPKKKEGSEGVYLDPSTGDVMTVEDQRTRRKTIERQVLQMILNWYNQASDEVADADKMLLNAKVFFVTKQGDTGFARVSYLTNNFKGQTPRTSGFTTKTENN